MLLNPNVQQIINNFIDSGSEQSMLELINISKEFQLTYSEIADIALGLAHSGQMIDSKMDKIYYDIPSSGGPSSLSTLVTPLVLSALHKDVLKLGVPGRPAGGIDVLSQIIGYQINPDSEEINEWLTRGRFIHVVANNRFTPLDLKFFEFRKKHDAVKIPSLVVASILAKKIAFGVKAIGLDIRVSQFGNFGSTWPEARNNAKLFNNVASLLGIRSVCYISNGFYPQQPYIGRGEALLALKKIFSDANYDNLLKKHLSYCYSMGIHLAGGSKGINFNGSILEKEFKENLTLQGGLFDSFIDIADRIENQHIYNISAQESGFLIIDLEKIRESILTIQNQIKDLKYPDPCGIILKAYSNEYISKGSIVCSFRCDKLFFDQFYNLLLLCFSYNKDINSYNELEII